MATRTQYIRNPQFAPGGTAWATSRVTLAQDTGVTKDGIPSGFVTVTATGTAYPYIESLPGSFAAGDTVYVSAFGRAGAAGLDGIILIQSWSAAPATVGTSFGPNVPLPTSGWAELTHSIVAPADTSYIRVILRVANTGGTSMTTTGNTAWYVQPLLGKSAGAYGDGTMDGWTWTGTPHASTSVLTIPDAATSVLTIGSSHIGPMRVGKD
jgi:hypothetical protein